MYKIYFKLIKYNYTNIYIIKFKNYMHIFTKSKSFIVMINYICKLIYFTD